jgi:UDP-N-acetylglucosamine 1-carboxyvinyltransferase
MDNVNSRFEILGGKKLKGTIDIRGAKNAALKIFASSLLASGPMNISNIPEVEDIARISELLSNLGVSVKKISHGKYSISSAGLKTTDLNPEIAKKLRASIVLTGPLLARMGKVSFPHPGGCVIGKRPIDVFLDGYKAMGIKIVFKDGIYKMTGKPKPIKFVFNSVSVTGTETLMMAAVFSKGTTFLKNCACEPEIVSLAEFLNSCGAKITGAGSPYITIEGVNKISGGNHSVIPDRIEAGTMALLAAATGSDITINKCEPEHLDALWSIFKKAGIKFKTARSSVRIFPSKPKTVSVKTHEYPGFPTDLQAPLCVMLTQAKGMGVVHETIYEGRLFWLDDLKRMGASVLMCDPQRVAISGSTPLRGRVIESPDLRAGMAYLIAALCAKGKSVLNNIYQIDRGYERIEERLKKLGAEIRRV